MQLSSHRNRSRRRPARPARSTCRFEPLEDRRLFAGGLDWSTFVGGANDDSVTDVAAVPDGSGDVLVTGTTNSDDFPGGGSRPEGADAFVARISGDGQRLVYATFFAGATPRYIAVAPDGSPVVAGDAFEDFATTPGAYASPAGELFVAKLDPTGNRVEFAARLGAGFSDGVAGVAVDGSGGIVIAGYTSNKDFPTTAGAFDRTLNEGEVDEEEFFVDDDAFVSRLSPDGTRLTYSTFLGGEGDDQAFAVTVDARGFITVVGETNPLSEDEDSEGNIEFGGTRFPTTAGAFQREFQSQEDGFVARIKPDGAGAADLRYSTILGSFGEDSAHGVAFDPNDPNKVVVSSRTDGWNWHTTRGAFQRTRVIPEEIGDPDLAVTAFRFNQSRGGRLEWSTLHGAINGYLYGSDIDVDGSGNIVVAGNVEVTLGADVVRPTTQGAFDHTPNTAGAFLTRLSRGGQRLLYETNIDHAGIGEPRVAAVGANSAVIAGSTFGDQYPTTPDALDTVLNDGELVSDVPDDGFVAKFTFGPMDPADTTAAAPTLLSPRNGARHPTPSETETGVASVTFDWTDVEDPSGVQLYELEISHNAEFEVQSETDDNKRMLVRVEESEAEVFHDFYGDLLHWRVRTLDDAGNFSRWSSSRRIQFGTMDEPRLAAMEVNPDGVTGGRTAQGKVLLQGVAPEGGTTLVLTSSDPDLASVPETVTVPAGKSSATFPILTRRVNAATAVWIQAQLGEDWSAPTLWIDPAKGSVPQTTTYQAESATRGGATVSASHRGYTGTGYLDFRNARGDFAEFRVDAAAAGSHTLTFRYANGGGAARSMGLSVNGTSRAGGVTFGRTASWSDWREVSVVVQLAEGTNRIRLTATGQSGPNLDSMTVSV